MRVLKIALVIAVAAVRARADGIADLPFEEERACKEERSSARLAAFIPAYDEAAASARIENARRARDGAPNAKVRKALQQSLDEAIADVENMRAARNAAIVRRDASAGKLAECVDRERSAYVARADARSAEEARKAAAEDAERARIEQLMNSAPTVRLALSAMVCVTNSERADELRAIADEKKYARIGGVQSNAKIYDLQQQVRESDQRTVRFNSDLKKRKTTAIKCSDPKVKQVATCIRAAVDDGPCLADDVSGPLQVVRVIEVGE